MHTHETDKASSKTNIPKMVILKKASAKALYVLFPSTFFIFRVMLYYPNNIQVNYSK